MSRLMTPLLEFPYLPKWIIFLVDISLSVVAFVITYLICYELLKQTVVVEPFLYKVFLNTVVTAFCFFLFRTYNGIIRHSTFIDVLRILGAVATANLIMAAISNLSMVSLDRFIFPNIGFFINFILTFTLVFATRLFVKLYYDFAKNNFNPYKKKSPLLIYGLNPGSVEVARMVKQNPNLPYLLAGFISPDTHALHKKILDVPVFSDAEMEAVIVNKRVSSILINPLELDRNVKQELADKCIRLKVSLLTAPLVSGWQENGVHKAKEINKIRIEDLLGRIPIQINIESIARELKGKHILVTGAAGSIGSEIVRQISKFEPDLLILCDIAETPLHELRLKLEEDYPKLKFLPIVSDVRNLTRMESIFRTYRPGSVYHAAAYKHVPLMEENPCESILTNVLGTKQIADLAVKYNSEVFVMVSTDKAVNPTNVMGASKRIAEMYVQSFDRYLRTIGAETKTRFITTRFGNVLGSNGSVIPRFKEQIEKGGPVTVTHPEIIRYFMTIPEACRLVLEAGNMGKGGEIFVFDMGDPVKIVHLAEKMIRLSGLEPHKDIEISYTGLRPGEKLYEELLNNKEATQPTYNRKIMIGKVREYDYEEVKLNLLQIIETARTFKEEDVIRKIKEIVPEFAPTNPIYSSLI